MAEALDKSDLKKSEGDEHHDDNVPALADEVEDSTDVALENMREEASQYLRSRLPGIKEYFMASEFSATRSLLETFPEIFDEIYFILAPHYIQQDNFQLKHLGEAFEYAAKYNEAWLHLELGYNSNDPIQKYLLNGDKKKWDTARRDEILNVWRVQRAYAKIKYPDVNLDNPKSPEEADIMKEEYKRILRYVRVYAEDRLK